MVAQGNWKELDTEAGTASPTTTGKSYWLGSMSNSSSFNIKPNRNRLIAITTTGTGAATTFANGGYVSNLRQLLITWGDNNGYNFTASAADGHDCKVIDGFNLEGMVFAPNNTTLYLGFRAPLVPTANRTKAVIAPIQSFESWFNNGNPVGNPTIGSPIELDLGGRGIRDIIHLTNGLYVIVAGSYDGTSIPALYKWTGNAVDAPLLMNTFDVTGLNAEAALQINEGGSIATNKLQIICDNGSAIYYNDGVESKLLPYDGFKKFSSDVLVASAGNPLPLNFVNFNATLKDKNVSLKWEVAQNDNLKSFNILRSTNGKDFTSIASVPAYVPQFAYAYTDMNVTGEKAYYRIRAVENKGTQLSSTIRLVNILSGKNTMAVYPNPVTNNLFTIDTKLDGKKTISILTANGSLYKEFSLTGNTLDINTNAWPKGNYVVRLITAEGITESVKVVVE